MFRPAKIYHSTIVLREDKVSGLIDNLYELGVCELKETDVDLESKYSYEYAKNIDEMHIRLKYLIDSLKEYKEIPQPENLVKALFKPKPPLKHKVTVVSNDELIEEVGFHLDLIEPKILEKLDKLKVLKEEIQKHEFTISNLSLMPEIETRLFQSSEHIKVFLGIISASSFPKIKEKLEKDFLFAVNKIKKNKSLLIAVFVPTEKGSYIDRFLHETGFETISIDYENKNPFNITLGLKKKIDKLKSEVRKMDKELEKIQGVYQDKLDILDEELTISKDRIDALKLFKTTKAFSVVEAWIPAKSLDRFNEVMKQTKDYYLEVEERDDAPTIFSNSKIVRPFEMITELYSAPKYKGFDPTPLVAISFPLFFGFMLTDAAYGILLLILALGMYYGAGKYNEKMKKFGSIFIIFSISTIIMGMIFGSYFGNFFQELGFKVPMLIDSMKQVMLALSIALGLGMLHLMVGLIAGFYDNIHNKNPKQALAKQGVWIVFIIGILLILFGLSTYGLVAIGLAVFMQLFFSFLEGGVVTSLLSIFGFSGFVGDLFSYARLMALGIGTSGISLAVNFMTFLAASMIPVIGIPVAIVVFIIGHSFNMAMNGLGAFIHSTRLHFLEFFTKFYDGGGRVYKPFMALRKNTYIDIKD